MSGLASLVHERFEMCNFKIPSSHWTVLAGIAVEDGGSLGVVALGAGLKCLPLEEYSRDPLYDQLVHDSHGEILARRAFLRYLLHQMDLCKAGEKSILQASGEMYQLKDGITLHMYISHAPCGDASMPAVDEAPNPARKRARLSENVQRGREDYAAGAGTLRTKPGRADAPLAVCMSCSDKIAKWTAVGLQGAALMRHLARPIYLSSLCVGDGFNAEALARALNSRVPLEQFDLDEFRVHRMQIAQATVPFVHCQGPEKSPCPEAHVWFEGCTRPETLVRGRRKGSAPPKNGALPIACRSVVSNDRLSAALTALFDQPSLPQHDTDAQAPYELAKQRLFALPAFRGWIRSRRPHPDGPPSV